MVEPKSDLFFSFPRFRRRKKPPRQRERNSVVAERSIPSLSVSGIWLFSRRKTPTLSKVFIWTGCTDRKRTEGGSGAGCIEFPLVHTTAYTQQLSLDSPSWRKPFSRPRFLARAIIDSRSHVLVFSLLSPGVARWCWRIYPDSTRQTGPVVCYMRGSNRRDKGVLSIFSIPLVAFSYHDVLDCSKAIEGCKSKAWDRRPKDHHERTLLVIYWRKEHWNTGGGRNKARGGKCMEITI